MKKHIIGTAIEELYRWFDEMNKIFYDNELPEPIIVIQKGRKTALGTCSVKKIWAPVDEEEVNEEEKLYEITLVANNLNRPINEIVVTLAHEMVHYFNLFKGVKGAKNKKHTEAFKREAERIGLVCTEEEKMGWGITEASDEFEEMINTQIKPNAEAFKYFLYIPTKEKKKTEKPPIKKYRCPKCGSEIKGKEGLDITCNDCNTPFVELP